MSNPPPFGERARPPSSVEPKAFAETRGLERLRALFGAAEKERRRHARIPLALNGRYMLECGREYPCVTRDISRMGVAIQGVPVGAIGERVIAYLDELGRIEGRVVRRAEDWFAIEIVATPHKLERLDDKISAIVRQGARRER
ncbi:MAG TPA: PilZ domain-containing protein [Roseiarcus sp.]|nr:PilZ domain-containing protein [Roseiarcus sp.]